MNLGGGKDCNLKGVAVDVAGVQSPRLTIIIFFALKLGIESFDTLIVLAQDGGVPRFARAASPVTLSSRNLNLSIQ